MNALLALPSRSASFALLRTIAITTLALCAVLPTHARAAVPGTVALTGVLSSTGGGPAADGTYQLQFALYPQKSGAPAIWVEGPVGVSVEGGRFVHQLGAITPFDASKLVGLTEAWFGVKVDNDPELPLQPLGSQLFAMRAGVADTLAQPIGAELIADGAVTAQKIANGAVGVDQLAPNAVGAGALGSGTVTADKVAFNFAGSQSKGGPADTALVANDANSALSAEVAKTLQCTGCVTVAMLNIDDHLDATGFSVKADAFVGDGSQLTGIPKPTKKCPAGQAVVELQADGTVICANALDPDALPADGIDEISNGLIHNQFIDEATSPTVPVAIADNNPVGVFDEIDFPDIGLAQALNVSVHITNSDLSTVRVLLFDPNNVQYVLLDKSGQPGDTLETTYPNPSAPAEGDLTTWIGQNPKGKWRLQVIDTGFKDNSTDGEIVSWKVAIQTLSTKKVQVKGDLIVDGNITSSTGDMTVKQALTAEGGITIGAAPNAACDANHVGKMRSSPKGLQVCTKSHNNDDQTFSYVWTRSTGQPVIWSGGCKSHGTGSGWARYCSDGIDFNTAADYFTTTGDGRFTFKISGYYRVHSWADGRDSSYRRCALRKNGNDFMQSHEYDGHNGWTQCTLDQIWPFKEGDYVEAWYQTNNGHYRWHSWNSSGQHSRTQIEYVGPLDQD